MTSSRGVTLALLGGVLGMTISASLAVDGCGGNDTGVATDGGSESAADVTTGEDAGGDADADVLLIPPGLLDWPGKVAGAYCRGLGKCCPGASTFNEALCASQNEVNGWEYSLPDRLAVYDAGHLNYDDDAANACLAALQNLPCGTETPAQYAAITNACFGVLSGRLPIGESGCTSSWECVNAAFCDRTIDGGVCSALVGQGQSCRSDEMCNYVGSAKPPLFCNVIDAPDAGGGTCKPLLANGAACQDTNGYYYDQSCASQLCGNDGQCGTNVTIPSQTFCNAYARQDAGGG
jgi:hypothetical protein